MSKRKFKAIRDRLKKYTVVVTCVVIKRGPGNIRKAIILKRSKREKEGPGLWTIPGGKLTSKDWGKPIRFDGVNHTIWMRPCERAVRREVREETGIKITNAVLMQGREKVFLRKDRTPTLILVFSAFCPRKTRVRLDKESGGFCWVTRQELQKYEFIGNVKEDLGVAFQLQDHKK